MEYDFAKMKKYIMTNFPPPSSNLEMERVGALAYFLGATVLGVAAMPSFVLTSANRSSLVSK